MQQSAPVFGRRNVSTKYPPASNSSGLVPFFPPTWRGGSGSLNSKISTTDWLVTLTPVSPTMLLKSEPTPDSPPPPIEDPPFDDLGGSEPTPGGSPPPTGQ